MPFSTTYANNILNWMFAKSTGLTGHSKIYIGLCSNDPEADGGTFNELSGSGYTRVLISQYNETYPDVIGMASNRSITNPKQINWTKATADWTAANGFGLFTTEAGGSPFYYAKLDLTEEQIAEGGLKVVAGAVALFDPNALKITFKTTDESAASST